MPKRVSKQQAQALLEKADKLKKRELKRTVIVPGPDRGDKLARGAPSATYSNQDLDVTQMEWDRAFMTDEAFQAKYGKKARKKN